MKITAIKQQLKRADRYSVFVDDTYAFSLGEAALLEQHIASGQELTAAELTELKRTSADDKAYGNTLRYVAMRPRSVWEVETYLRRKEVEEPTAEVIMKRLMGTGLLDDMAFSRAWVNTRRLLKSTSRQRLRLELKQKHVGEQIITQVLHEDETSDRDALRELIDKKRSRYPDRRKFMQYLARQGFGYDDIRSALETEGDS